MTVNYTDIVTGMVEVDKRGLETVKVVLTEESMESFLLDDKYTKEIQAREEETIGSDWSITVESGDDNYLVTSSGERIDL